MKLKIEHIFNNNLKRRVPVITEFEGTINEFKEIGKVYFISSKIQGAKKWIKPQLFLALQLFV